MPGTSFPKLRHLRNQIAQREIEVADIVLQAQKKSHRRLRATSERYDAENELEEALLELTRVKERGRATTERSSEVRPLLKEDVSSKRQELLAASPPFILALEQALVLVASVDQAAKSRPPAPHERWRSTLKVLMKDVSEGIEHFQDLSSREENRKDAHLELTLAAASARRLSLHVNAWTTHQLSEELERIWLQAVEAQAKADPLFRHVVSEWKMASQSLSNLSSATREASIVEKAEQDAVGTRVRECQVRAGIRPKVKKEGWWKQRQQRFLMEEMWHIEHKLALVASPSSMMARYNILLAKCAEAGAWTTAVSAYRAIRTRGLISKGVRDRHKSSAPTSLESFVYQYLLRAAKNASPPQPRAAMVVLREMRLRGYNPAAVHYNLVIGACARASAVAASTSGLILLKNDSLGGDNAGSQCGPQEASQDAVAAKCSREEGGGAKHICDSSEGDPTRVENAAQVPGHLDDSEDVVLKSFQPPEELHVAEHSEGETDEARHYFPLSTGGEAVKCREAETAGNSWRLALEVIADMRERGLTPTDVTFQTLVECCRCAAAAPLPELAGDGARAQGSTPQEVYTALREAGIPSQFCYQAGLKNALEGRRCFPEYVAEMRR